MLINELCNVNNGMPLENMFLNAINKQFITDAI